MMIYKRKYNPGGKRTYYKQVYTTLTNFSMKYLVMCSVYTGVSGIKKLYHVCPPVRKIIHSLKLVDYLDVQADNSWYNYYITNVLKDDENFTFS